MFPLCISNSASSSRMKSSTSSKAASPQTPQTPQEKQDVVENIVKGLTNVYLSRIKPVEDAYEFSHFQSPPLSEADIQSKPIVLLLGQYSVGKSTFIKHLLGKEYPGCNIGPEPTTDRFYSIMSSPNGEDRIIPGNAAAVSSDLPYTSLTRLGTAFLEKFQVCQMSSSILDSITLIDTPGVLSGEKQRINRQYEFTDVIKWFAERADIILLIFVSNQKE